MIPPLVPTVAGKKGHAMEICHVTNCIMGLTLQSETMHVIYPSLVVCAEDVQLSQTVPAAHQVEMMSNGSRTVLVAFGDANTVW